MDTGTWDYPRGAALLAEEAELLGKISSLQEKLRTVVTSRDWTDFEGLLGSLQQYGEDFERLEAERQRLFGPQRASPTGDLSPSTGSERSLTQGRRPPAEGTPSGDGEQGGGFYAFTARLPPEAREGLLSAYRALRLEALRVRLGNDALLEYLNGARTAAAAFLEAAFPERGGRLYSRQGFQAPSDMRSMVFNRHF